MIAETVLTLESSCLMCVEPAADKFVCATYNELVDVEDVCNSIVDCFRDLSDEIGSG